MTPTENGTYTKSFGKPFIDTQYSVCVTCENWYDSSYACQIGVTKKETGEFSFRISGSSIASVGYIAIGKWK